MSREELTPKQKTDLSLQPFPQNVKVGKPVLMAGVPGSLGSSPDHLECLEEVGDRRGPEVLQARVQNFESLNNLEHVLVKGCENVIGCALHAPD